jgi:hypothetical protein
MWAGACLLWQFVEKNNDDIGGGILAVAKTDIVYVTLIVMIAC